MITKRVFGKTAKGEEVIAYTLTDGAYSLTVLNYGGIVQKLVVPDRDGNPVDVVLGYNDVEGYETHGGYLGALIGRFGNRIGEGKLTVDGKEYALYLNDRGNHLHGGKEGFNKKIWEVQPEGNSLVLSLVSPDGEENYPGTLKVTVRYTLEEGEWRIEYTAVSDKKTAINLTNHAYFNLSGEGDGSILDHILEIDAGRITPTNPTMIPVGGFRDVKGTAFDFTSPKEIGRDIEAEDIDLKQGNGYDHCYIINKPTGEYAQYAVAESKKTGIRMACLTDLPAVQFYAGNGLKQQGKTTYYGKRAGFCLETQFIPNNVNVEEYAALGSSYLDAGKEFRSVTAYRFSAK